MSSPAAEAVDISPTNKKIALLISILALFLAISDISGKQAENDSVAKNIEASNLWSFFQAKTIRRADAIVASETMAVNMGLIQDPLAKAAMQKQIDSWRANAARLESEPDTNEGRKELIVRAKTSEAARDLLKTKNEKFEMASGLFQIAIVLASASIITGISLLVFAAGGMGLLGVALVGLGFFAPTALF